MDGDILWKDHCEFDGQDLAFTPDTTQADCRKMCSNNPKCAYFNWYLGNNNNKNLCYLKKGIWDSNNEFRRAAATAQCGYPAYRSFTEDGWTVDGDVVWKDDCLFAGRQYLSSSTNTTRADCREMCTKKI